MCGIAASRQRRIEMRCIFRLFGAVGIPDADLGTTGGTVNRAKAGGASNRRSPTTAPSYAFYCLTAQG